MSLQLRLFGSGQPDAPKNGGSLVVNDGGHSIDKSKALTATSAEALSPMNPGKFASGKRSVPIIEAPRYFEKDEAVAMEGLAKEKEKGVKYSKRAYSAALRIDTADTKVHKLHRRYEGGIAKNELRKVKANTTYATGLHGLRFGYAKQGARIDKADSNARESMMLLKPS
jgi:hypothetical protein